MMNDFFTSIFVRLYTLRDERGQTAVEYALVLSLVAIVLAVALGAGLGTALTTLINKIKTQLA